MPDASVSLQRLDCVAHGVTEVQDHPEPGFPLVTAHHLGLDRAAPFQHRNQELRFQVHDPIQVRLQPLEERLVSDRRVLDQLRHPRRQLAVRQASQRGDVHPDQAAR
jgi:hypothetical protein